jgi:hypothetical protein
MSYSESFPTQRPIFTLDAANAGRLDSRISYSRSTTGTYFGTEKVLSSENLIVQSQSFDTTWGLATEINAPTGGQTAPDGTSTAWLLTAGASGTGTPMIFQSLTADPANNALYTYVVHLKAGTASHAYISFRGQSSSAAWALIDFASPTSPTTGGSLGSISATSVALGNSWYRVALTFNTGTITAGGYPYVYIGPSDGTSPDSTGRVSYTYAGETLYAWGAQLSSTQTKVYDSPTTTQIAREYQTKLQTAAINAPRFEFSATDSASAAMGESLGLLVEGQSTNLITRSHELDNASWNKGELDVDANAAIGVDGTLTADLLRPTTASGVYHYLLVSVSTTASSTYTASAYVKAAGYSKLNVFFYQSGTREADATFTLSGSGSASTAVGSSTITAVGGGYYRISVTGVAGSSQSYMQFRLVNDSGSAVFAGDGYSGIICTGVQFELGSFPSSLISTSGSAATRASDSATMVSSSLFDNGGGTLYAEASQNVLDTYNGVFAVSDGTGANTIEILGNSSSFRGQVVNANSTNASFIGGTITVGQFNKHALTFSSSEASYYVNGSEIGTTDSSVVVPTVSEIDIGNVAWSRPLNGHIKRVAVYSEPISETEAAALTS